MELESGHDQTEVQQQVQDRDRPASDGSGVAMARAARDLDLAESVLRRWMRELTEIPAAALTGIGQLRADLAENSELKNEVARLRAERNILMKATAFSCGR